MSMRIYPVWTDEYAARVAKRAIELNSDGCSGVLDLYLPSCFEHDVHYRTHHYILVDLEMDRRTADWIFRGRIQELSSFGIFSPVSWWRWLGVRVFGRSAWKSSGSLYV